MHSPLFAPFLQMLWFLIPLVVIGTVVKSAWFKGVMGEWMINSSVQKNLNPEIYCLLKNVTIPSDGGTTQIDHVIVSRFGIFVLETKNMQGWIFGSERQKSWTQQIYKHKTKFQNPLHQNYKHVKTLQQLLNLSDSHIYSLVVFVGGSTFKTEMPVNVVQGKAFLKFIQDKTEVVLSEQEVKSLVSQIEEGRLQPNLKTHVKHVRNVKKIVKEKQNQVRTKADVRQDEVIEKITQDEPLLEEIQRQPSVDPFHSDSTKKLCPKCGSAMILRETKKGRQVGQKFWGCSQFPECWFIAKEV